MLISVRKRKSNLNLTLKKKKKKTPAFILVINKPDWHIDKSQIVWFQLERDREGAQ